MPDRSSEVDLPIVTTRTAELRSLKASTVFAVDVLKCEKCGGRLRIVEIAKTPDDIARVLNEPGSASAS